MAYPQVAGHLCTGAARPARRNGRGKGRRRGLRAREGKRPCRIARRVLGYARARHCGIARGRVRIPAPLASANLPVCARAGRQGEFLGASVAAA